MSDALEIAVENHVAHVRLNRPEAHNAIDGPIMEGLLDFARRMIDDPGAARVVVSKAPTGALRSFGCVASCR